MTDCYGKKICNKIFCMNFKKDVQCCKCGVWLCKCCDIRIKNKTYCADCLVNTAFEKLDNLFKKQKEIIPEKINDKFISNRFIKKHILKGGVKND